ncbi:hypothetical protein [Thalassospira lohafexi]|uniref:Uncharacterized protein n=1 Tax=Thalassospira lohafexi TaxID=744227 RepID=A0A2N3L1H7_9PROT|nr:hypothetical protein [Thalassospira lohafexi]PKR56658.1 hypothetical protein COO92_19795 [Thalassospira lohafexi]
MVAEDQIESVSGKSGSTDFAVPQFRRNLFPRNLVLSVDDLCELSEILSALNDRAKEIEIAALKKNPDEKNPEEVVNSLMLLDYQFVEENDNNVIGTYSTLIDSKIIPKKISSVFFSNFSHCKNVVKQEPLNCIGIFIDFQRPSMLMDLSHIPSSATNNRTVVNVYGRDEGFVVWVEMKLKEFFESKKRFQPIVHLPVVYDNFLYLIFLPLIFYSIKFFNIDHHVSDFTGGSVLLDVLIGIWILLVSIIAARFCFQYLRWVFPPTEFYQKSRVGPRLHRAALTAILAIFLYPALYDVSKLIYVKFFP